MSQHAGLARISFALALSLIACDQEASFKDAQSVTGQGSENATALPPGSGTPAGEGEALPGEGADGGTNGGGTTGGAADVDSDTDEQNGNGTTTTTDDVGGPGGGTTGGDGMTAGGTDNGTGGGTEGPIDTPMEVKASCEKSPMQTKVQTLSFPDPGKTCNWGEEGNGEMAEDRIRARTEQKVSLAIPANAIICDLAFSFDESQMTYDDEIFLTFNDIVLAASMDYTPRFAKTDGFYRYDWEKLLDAKYGHNLFGTYCLGSDRGLGECKIPPTQKRGRMKLAFKPQLVHELAVEAIKAQRFDFGWVTLGDNNPEFDCRHDDYEFRATIKYVLK